jgi:hypothetical protein
VVGLRLDGSLFLSAPTAAPDAVLPALPCLDVEMTNRYRSGLIPEKVWAGWNGPNLEVTVGDGYVNFGRGLTLSLRKTDELGLDTTNRGLRVKLQTSRVSGTLVGGITNIGNFDEASGRAAADPNDVVVGLETYVRIVDGIRVGAHAAGFAFAKPVSSFAAPGSTDAYRERWLSAGPVIDAPRITKWLGIYLEGIGQRRQHVDGAIERGYGLYGSGTVSVGQATILLEGKWYGDLATVQPKFSSIEFQPVQYATPPTLERVLQPLEHPQQNISGARTRFDWSFSKELSVFANYGLFKDDEGYLDPETVEIKPGTIHDPYVGIDIHKGGLRVQGQGGVRLVFLPDAAGAVRTDGHVDVTTVYGFQGGWTIEFHGIHWERSKILPLTEERWREGTLQLGFRKRPKFSVSGILDYTTEAGQPSVWYPGGTAQWEFTESSNVRLFAGSSRGGLRCVSGVCRVFPPFSGAKVTLTLRL